MGVSSELAIFNVTDPEDPIFLNQITVGSTTYGMTIDENHEYLYVAAMSNSLTIYNVSDAENPELVWGKDDNPNHNSRWTYDVFVRGNYAYCADSVGLRIYDISTPAETESVAYLEKSGTYTSWSVAPYGDNKLLLGQGGGIIDMIDISDPENPVLGENIKASSDIKQMVVSGNTLLAADDSDGLVSFGLSSSGFSYGKLMDAEESRGSAVAIDADANYVYFAGYRGFFVYDFAACVPGGGLFDEISGYSTSIIALGMILGLALLLSLRKRKL